MVVDALHARDHRALSVGRPPGSASMLPRGGSMQSSRAPRDAALHQHALAGRDSGTRRCSTARPEWAGEIALHHGSLDREHARLRSRTDCATDRSLRGVHLQPRPRRRLPPGRAACCSSAARRASRGCCSAPADRAIAPGAREPRHLRADPQLRTGRDRGGAPRGRGAGPSKSRRPLVKPLDVLVQHVVTVATRRRLRRRARNCSTKCARTHAYRDLTDEEWQWALRFRRAAAAPALGGVSRVPHALRVDDGPARVIARAAIARRHRMSVGTIVSDASMRCAG